MNYALIDTKNNDNFLSGIYNPMDIFNVDFLSRILFNDIEFV